MKRGTVIEDSRGKLWVCVREGEGPAPDISALMHCEDQRIDKPIRWLKNIPSTWRIFSLPVE